MQRLTRKPVRAPAARTRMRGFALLEALVSILLLAVAVLGMLGVQLRLLADTQIGARRAQGVRLIEDLAERIKSNPEGIRHLDRYVSAWDDTPQASDCARSACDAAALARSDIAAWKQAVAQTLPLGRAAVFQVAGPQAPGPRRELGVMVAWRATERSGDDPAYAAPFVPSPSGSGIECPDGLICHLAHVQP